MSEELKITEICLDCSTKLIREPMGRTDLTGGLWGLRKPYYFNYWRMLCPKCKKRGTIHSDKTYWDADLPGWK
jgi:hypothetical protein